MNTNPNWRRKKFTITVCGSQANTILRALSNESTDDIDGEYERVYTALAKKLEAQGFWDNSESDII